MTKFQMTTFSIVNKSHFDQITIVIINLAALSLDFELFKKSNSKIQSQLSLQTLNLLLLLLYKLFQYKTLKVRRLYIVSIKI
jgi:hypothetical protein